MKCSSIVKTLALTAVLGLTTAAHADILYQEGFETPGMDKVTDFAGWTATDSRNYVRVPDTTGWVEGTTGYKAAMFFPYNQTLYSPSVDTSAYDQVSVSYDFRPGKGTWGGQLFFLGSDGKTVTRLFLNDQGNVMAHDGYDSDTGIDWAYVDANTTYHLELLIDNVNKTYDLIWDNLGDAAAPTVVSGLAWTEPTSNGTTGTFASLSFKGGRGMAQTATSEWLVFDNIVVEGIATEIPEPATMTLLGLGGLAMLRRRRA